MIKYGPLRDWLEYNSKLLVHGISASEAYRRTLAKIDELRDCCDSWWVLQERIKRRQRALRPPGVPLDACRESDSMIDALDEVLDWMDELEATDQTVDDSDATQPTTPGSGS